MHGETIWKNPRGFLPGGQQPLLPFQAAVALLYALIGGTWILAHLLHRGAVLPQQYLITVAVVLGATEACMSYGDMASLNETGFPNHALQVRCTRPPAPWAPAGGRRSTFASTPALRCAPYAIEAVPLRAQRLLHSPSAADQRTAVCANAGDSTWRSLRRCVDAFRCPRHTQMQPWPSERWERCRGSAASALVLATVLSFFH